MDTPRNFRSALNGFNREDVVRYIEYMNAQHVAQVNELNVELEFLRGKLNNAAPAELDPAVAKRLEDYKEQVRILEARCDSLEKERDDRPRSLDVRLVLRWRSAKVPFQFGLCRSKRPLRILR